jgi:hypothetical protein
VELVTLPLLGHDGHQIRDQCIVGLAIPDRLPVAKRLQLRFVELQYLGLGCETFLGRGRL